MNSALLILSVCSCRVCAHQFDPSEAPLSSEKDTSLALLSRMDSDARKTKRREPTGGDGETLNVRKAVRFASKGRGGAALGREMSRGSIKGRGGGGGGKPKGRR